MDGGDCHLAVRPSRRDIGLVGHKAVAAQARTDADGHIEAGARPHSKSGVGQNIAAGTDQHAGGGASSARRALRVLLASDDPFSREAFRLASRAPDIEVVAVASVREVADHLPAELAADVVVLDAQVAAVDALSALQRVRSRMPSSRVLVFSTPESTEFGLLCLSMGASGYLSKDIDLKALPRVLHRLGRGEAIVSRAFTAPLIERMRAMDHRGGPREKRPITPPEQQILELLRTGRSVSEAATELGVTKATIKRHLASARRKLTADEPYDATAGNPPPAVGARHREVLL